MDIATQPWLNPSMPPLQLVATASATGLTLNGTRAGASQVGFYAGAFVGPALVEIHEIAP